MTHQQKIIVSKLLQGCSIAASDPGCIRLRDPEGRPLIKVSSATFSWLNSNLLRKKKSLFVLNKTKMRAFHGNSYVKKLYKGKASAPGARNTPPPIKRRSPDRPAEGLTLF